MFVAVYGFLPIFYEAIDILDLQPSARSDHVEACRPHEWCPTIVRFRRVPVKGAENGYKLRNQLKAPRELKARGIARARDTPGKPRRRHLEHS